jgi:hydrogenase small subunit
MISAMSAQRTTITRRAFVRRMALGTLTVPVLMQGLSERLSAQGDPPRQPIIWLQGQSSGIQNSGLWSQPELIDFLDKYFRIIPVTAIDSDEFLADSQDRDALHLLILEGFFSNDPLDWLQDLLKDLIVVSRAVILLGNEACWGDTVPEGFMNLETDLLHLVETPYYKLPGAPVPARHLLGTLNHLVLYDLPAVDEYRRPTMFYATPICHRCEFRRDFEAGRFLRHFGDGQGCLYRLGCKGPFTWNSCPVERWNGTSNWCVGAGSPCTGCSEPDFPANQGLGMFGQLPAGTAETNAFFLRHSGTIAKGVFGVTAAGIALHAIAQKTAVPLHGQRMPAIEDDEDE